MPDIENCLFCSSKVENPGQDNTLKTQGHGEKRVAQGKHIEHATRTPNANLNAEAAFEKVQDHFLPLCYFCLGQPFI